MHRTEPPPRDAAPPGQDAEALERDMPDPGEPWFVPPAAGSAEVAAAAPSLRAADWIAAEARLGRPLARATAAAARLDERVRHMGPGALRRLALDEAAAISWQAGDRVAVDRLTLHDLDRADMARDDAAALAAAHWAYRRLASGPDPATDPSGFLARDGLAADAAFLRWSDGLDDLAAALPLVQAAWAFRAWRVAGLGAGLTEPAVLAARIGGRDAAALPFLPLAATAAPYFAGGDTAAWLAAWARAAEAGALRALMALDALAAWRGRAAAATAHLSGRTPALLVEALEASPALSAGMAARATGASVAGARRNLGRFERAGLVREITGQGRFRFWQAAI